MRFNSLFSGIGGFDLGFDQAGLVCASQTEWNADCQYVLNKHFPNVTRFSDVRGLTGRTGKGWSRYNHLPAADVLCGGFPCQDVSVAGHRRGLAGSRSGLWFEFHRLITETLPGIVVVENVPGLLSSNGGNDFATILLGLTGILPEVPKNGWRNSGFSRGFFYSVAWRVLDAQYFGVPQRRRRLILVASLGNGSAAKILFEPESVSGHPAPRRETRQENPESSTRCADARSLFGGVELAGTLAASGAGLDRPSGNGNQLDFCIPVSTFVMTLGHTRSNGLGIYEQSVANTLEGNSSANQAVAVDVRNLRLNEDGNSGTLQAKATGGYSLNYSNPVLVPTAFGGGNSKPIEVSTTLTAHGVRQDFEAETFVVPPMSEECQIMGVRRLMPVECERLQGFPENWTEGQADAVRYRQLGNAVCVNVARWLGAKIIMYAE